MNTTTNNNNKQKIYTNHHGERVMTVEEVRSTMLTETKIEALMKHVRPDAVTDEMGNPTLATMSVVSDSYSYKIIDVEFYKSGKKKGEIKTMMMFRCPRDVAEHDKLYSIATITLPSYTHNDRFENQELNGEECVDVTIVNSFWTKEGEFKHFGIGDVSSCRQVSVGYARDYRCMER
tara:strand:+ start:1382 stop:1912 length:531 start_codon:yes stop_codon:yes gene_type:complete